ncbi:flagellar basal-body MS-ring/collar protein FliF [Fibrobacterota bacterium]
MSDFFKQLVNQLNAIWQKLNITQKIILISTSVISIVGMAVIIAWSSLTPKQDGNATLFVNLEPEDAAQVTEALKEMGTEYNIENNGRSITVPRKELYEVRMEMARNGLPKSGGQGFELFDNIQLGMTDFVQNLNYQRALEGEITRSIETLLEIERARVHITIPKPTLFKEKKEEATASVVLKLNPGKYLEEGQVRGITHLVASSVEGLFARQVTVLDIHGHMLTKGFADNVVAELADHNMSLQRGVETHLEKKIVDIFQGLLGPNKVRVKVNADLDFEQVEKTVESYVPTSKVVRSQQRDDGIIKNSPITGDEQSEGSITNYEIDKTLAKIINAPGTRKRITVSVVVDGIYKTDKDGKKSYLPRTDEEINKYISLVKNTVGFRGDSDDEVFVTNMQFDREFYHQEQAEMASLERKEVYKYWGKFGIVSAIILFGFLFLRSLARNIARAMNPPVPRYAGIALEPEEEEIPENMVRQNEILERVEAITRENPMNIASLIKGWLYENKNIDNQ